MALIKFANFAKARIATAPTGTSGLTFTVEAGFGALFPVLGVDEYFYGVFKNEVNNFEIVKIEARSADAFTIEAATRGFDGTAARTWLTGDVFVGALIRAAINEVIGNDSLNALGNLTPAADKVPYYTSSEEAALADFTAVARSLVADLTATAMRSTLDAVGNDADETITGDKDFTGIIEFHGAAPVIFQGASDDPTNKVTVNVDDPSQAVAITIPDLSQIRLWNLPAGIMVPYAGTSIPVGWLDCDFTDVSRTTYAALFAAIGTTWGVGDGSTTFTLPSGLTRTMIGDQGGRSVGDYGGAETHTLTLAQMPPHSHTGRNAASVTADFGIFPTTTAGNTGSAGSGAAHNNMQPYAVCKYIISY